MSTANFTPGPWIAQTWVQIADGGSAPIDIVAPGAPFGKPIAEIQFDINRGVGSAEATANARLIEAAPDMHYALEAARDILVYLRENGTTIPNTLEVIEAALAKAEGKGEVAA